MSRKRAGEAFIRFRGAAARCHMLRSGNMAGKCVIWLAASFCLFTLAQTARPLESIALFSRPGLKTRCAELTRHTLKEVGTRAADLSAEAKTESIDPVPQGPPRISPLSPAEPMVWRIYVTVHRRLPPSPPPDDTH